MIDLTPAQHQCIAQAIYGEARGESQLGQRAIGWVVLNRATSRHLTPCQVVHEPGQFSFKFLKHYSGEAWKKCYQIAYWLGKDPVAGSTYFHNLKCHPSWHYKLVTQVGNHLFYKDTKKPIKQEA